MGSIVRAQGLRRGVVAASVLMALTLIAPAAAHAAAAPVGSGKTVAFGLTRSGSAGVTGGACGTRLQCFKTAIADAATSTTPVVERAALFLVNVADADQDVNLKLSGKQLLIPPDADPSLNGKPDYLDAVAKVSLGGGTCYACALQAVELSFAGARADSPKVIVMLAERENTFRSTGFTSAGLPTGYPPMELADMAGRFDANTVVRAFAVGPATSCSHDPNGYGSLNDVAAVTPGGTCTEVASFDGLDAHLTEAVVSGGPSLPPPDETSPTPTLTTPAAGAEIEDTALIFAGAAGTAGGDEQTVRVNVWQGADAAGTPLQTLVTTASSGAYSVMSPPVAAGSYVAQAEQRDAAGNIGRSTVVPFTVVHTDTPPPPPPTEGSYAEAVRADTPRAYWRLGETSGLLAAEDQHRADGSYIGGTLLGVPGAPAQDLNTAARFDGGNDRVSVPDPPSGILDPGVEDFTVETWVKPAASDERGIVAKRSADAAAPYWALTVTDDPNHNGQVRAIYGDGTTTRTAYSSQGTLDGGWHHVVVWFDRDSGITVSVDGVTKATAGPLTESVGNAGELQIGKAPNNPYFKGDIDELAVYEGLVPLQRIQAHAAAAR